MTSFYGFDWSNFFFQLVFCAAAAIDVKLSKVPVVQVVDAARKALYTGHIGDGKIFVCGEEQAVKVRTNERGCNALQGEE